MVDTEDEFVEMKSELFKTYVERKKLDKRYEQLKNEVKKYMAKKGIDVDGDDEVGEIKLVHKTKTSYDMKLLESKLKCMLGKKKTETVLTGAQKQSTYTEMRVRPPAKV